MGGVTSRRPGSLRSVVAAAAKIDPSKVEIGLMLRCTAGVAIPLVSGALAGNPVFGVAAAAGALITGMASQQGVYRTRAIAMLWTASAIALSSFVGGISGHATAALVVLTAMWAYGGSLVASLGPAATGIGINSVVALVIFSDLQLDARETALQSLLVLGGGLFETLLVVLVWPIRRYAAERTALAGAFRTLAAYASSAGEGALSLPESQALRTVRTTLADPQPFARRGDIAAFQALLDEAERIRASLAALATDRYHLSASGAAVAAGAIDSVAAAAAFPLTAIATALDTAHAPVDDRDAWRRLNDAAGELAAQHGGLTEHAQSVAQALLGQLRAAWRTAHVPVTGEHPVIERTPERRIRLVPTIDDAFVTLRSNASLRSPYGRHALRSAVTLGVAVTITRLLEIPHDYWVAMTAILVLKPDFTTTFARGIARVGGTLVGAVLATEIALYAHPANASTIVLTSAFAGLAALFLGVNYGIFTIAITAYVVFLLSFVGLPEPTAVADRVVATLLGGGLAGAAYFVWPTWESRRTSAQIADLLEADRVYANALLAAYIDPSLRDEDAIRAAQTNAWTARADADTSVDRLVSEPGRTHRLPVSRALGILAASRRVALGLLTLNGHLARAAVVARPALAPFRDALDRAMTAEVDALRTGGEAGYPPLRPAYQTLEAAFATNRDPDSDLLLSECDLLVDSVNTIGELMRAEPSAPDPLRSSVR